MRKSEKLKKPIFMGIARVSTIRITRFLRIVENDAQILPGLYSLHKFFIFFILIPSWQQHREKVRAIPPVSGCHVVLLGTI